MDESESIAASLFADIIQAVVPTLGTISGPLTSDSTAPVDSTVYDPYIQQIQQKDQTYADVASALGEVITVCPHVFPATPETIITHTRNLESRQGAAIAVGRIFIDNPDTPKEIIQCTLDWAKNTDINENPFVRQIVGEATAAHRSEFDIPAPVQPLVAKVCNSRGIPRQNAVLALSESVISGDGANTAVDPTPALQEKTGNVNGRRKESASALGEAVITMEPSDCVVNSPLDGRESVEQHEGRTRKYSTRALGLAVAADSPQDLPTTLVQKAHTGKSQVRWGAGRALGELVGILDIQYDITPWPNELISQLHATDSTIRFERAGTIGEAIAALEAENHDIRSGSRLAHRESNGVERVINHVLTRGGLSRSWSAEVLGELIISGAASEYSHEWFTPLIEAATDAEMSERKRMAKVLGEATAVTSSSHTGIAIIRALTRQIQLPDRYGREEAAHMLGEIVADTEASYSNSKIYRSAAQTLEKTEGQDRWILAQALGELEAAIKMPSTSDTPMEALADRALGGDNKDWAAAAAIGTLVAKEAVQSNIQDSVPDDLIDVFNNRRFRIQKAAAGIIGLIAIGNPTVYITSAAEAILDDTSTTRAEILPEIAATNIFTPAEFVAILTETTESSQTDGLSPYLSVDNDGYEYVIDAVREAAYRTEEFQFPSLQTQIEDTLSESTTGSNSPATRLSMIDILININ